MGTNQYGSYISGLIEAYSTVNGQKVSLTSLPKITLKSTTGAVNISIDNEKYSGNLYYFIVYISPTMVNGDYLIEVADTNASNTSQHKVTNIPYASSKSLGTTSTR